MAWKHLLQIALGSAVLLAQSLTHSSPTYVISPHPRRVEVGELLSYDCARSIATLVNPSEQTGPLFADGKLVFTSLETQDSSKILLVNAGYGNFVINLEAIGVNRIRFVLPVAATGPTRTFFLSYMHGGLLKSRYFEFSEGRAPLGRDEMDYSFVSAHRAENLMPHLDYAIHETAAATLSAIVEGRVARSQLQRHRVDSCEHISRQTPNVAKNLRHSIDQIDLIVMGPKHKIDTVAENAVSGSRGPASVPNK